MPPTLPVNTDAEEALLACMLLDEAVVDTALERGISPDSFTTDNRAKIFEAIRDLRELDEAIDEIAIQFHLQAKGEDPREIYSYLTAIQDRVDTTVHAKQWTEEVATSHVRRRLVRAQLAFGEKLGKRGGDLSGAISELQTTLEAAALQTGRSRLHELLARSTFDAASQPPEDPTLYHLDGKEIAHPGNLIMLSAQAGCGKTSFASAAMAAPMAVQDGDFLGITSENPNGFALLHFDTEQSSADHHRQVRRALKRAGRDTPPTWFRSVLMTGWKIDDMFPAVALAMKEAQLACGGIHAVFLDGVADFIKSVNDEEEVLQFVWRLHALAEKFETVIFCVLHLNPSSESKTRGHLGSQLDRKCETVIQLTKDDTDTVTAWTSKTRRGAIRKEDGPRFRWDDETGMHISCPKIKLVSKDQAEAERLVRVIWGPNPGSALTYSDLVKQTERATGQSKATAKRKVGLLQQMALIQKDKTGNYILTQQGRDLTATP